MREFSGSSHSRFPGRLTRDSRVSGPPFVKTRFFHRKKIVKNDSYIFFCKIHFFWSGEARRSGTTPGEPKKSKKHRFFSAKNQSLFRIFQFYLFFAPRIAFWPENRFPDQIKHAISPNIMDFGDFCIHFFRNFEICKKIWHLTPKVSIDF